MGRWCWPVFYVLLIALVKEHQQADRQTQTCLCVIQIQTVFFFSVQNRYDFETDNYFCNPLLIWSIPLGFDIYLCAHLTHFAEQAGNEKESTNFYSYVVRYHN